MDFRDLNNTCPKGDFSLAITKLLVDTTIGFGALFFMDCFSRYNQIKMNPEDNELTTFWTPQGTYCYTVMPFGLKNVGATYQRAMTIIFHDIFCNLLECSVDNLVLKTKDRANQPHHLRKVFQKLRMHQLKMNPLK